MFKVHHVAISVKDLSVSEEFYKKLGFRKVSYWKAEDNSLEISHMKLNGFILEIFCFKNPEENPVLKEDLWTNLKVLGVKHFALQTEDIYTTLENLKKTGIATEETTVSKGRTGILYFFVKDPDGIFVEIVEDKRNL